MGLGKTIQLNGIRIEMSEPVIKPSPELESYIKSKIELLEAFRKHSVDFVNKLYTDPTYREDLKGDRREAAMNFIEGQIHELDGLLLEFTVDLYHPIFINTQSKLDI